VPRLERGAAPVGPALEKLRDRPELTDAWPHRSRLAGHWARSLRHQDMQRATPAETAGGGLRTA
jgi:hypothetical protein